MTPKLSSGKINLLPAGSPRWPQACVQLTGRLATRVPRVWWAAESARPLTTPLSPLLSLRGLPAVAVHQGRLAGGPAARRPGRPRADGVCCCGGLAEPGPGGRRQALQAHRRPGPDGGRPAGRGLGVPVIVPRRRAGDKRVRGLRFWTEGSRIYLTSERTQGTVGGARLPGPRVRGPAGVGGATPPLPSGLVVLRRK